LSGGFGGAPISAERIAYFFTFIGLITTSMKQLSVFVVAAFVGLPTGTMLSDITPPGGPLGGRAIIPEEYSYRYVFIPWLKCGFKCSSHSCVLDKCNK